MARKIKWIPYLDDDPSDVGQTYKDLAAELALQLNTDVLFPDFSSIDNMTIEEARANVSDRLNEAVEERAEVASAAKANLAKLKKVRKEARRLRSLLREKSTNKRRNKK